MLLVDDEDEDVPRSARPSDRPSTFDDGDGYAYNERNSLDGGADPSYMSSYDDRNEIAEHHGMAVGAQRPSRQEDVQAYQEGGPSYEPEEQMVGPAEKPDSTWTGIKNFFKGPSKNKDVDVYEPAGEDGPSYDAPQ